MLAGALAACGGDDDGGASVALTWYINPDNGGQVTLAEECSEASGGAYTITTQILPNEADAQREQLVRRLAAGDESVDLMSLDPPFVAEFANAGYLKPVTDQADVDQLTAGVLDGPDADGRVGRRVGGHAVLGQHAAAVVPQVGGAGRRRRPAVPHLHVEPA